MSSSMEQLYQQVILDHAKFPHGRGLAVVADAHLHSGQSHQVNPTCGDEVTLRVDLDTDGATPVVRDVRWEGQGCSISQASISVLHDLVVGADLTTVEQLSGSFRELMHARGAGLDDAAEDALGDATAFTGVAKYPARVKCALLGWAALSDALIKTGATGPREDQ
ncbi:Fe-S cluster assembly sulfur transfer protein SufU [Cellulomonas soli]|uniref:Iron-sulfur cluster assembly scaffold protein NifU n=1 Tax=Cellulomonas soli TaxID=931535 RepID=A0A512PH49_9CELL|nr:SUF system NifU family Fe-S cluster assembly protein [Cellulomonas soli]NYI60885.1 nitrogen fixation NifU-like protein [Cellulomonas soli]GEP70531.1 iron-sulfur cluster assembly scaffold protein NifU [Cellulomonas soli]